MSGFAGWEMPVQYPMGVMGEHLHTRAKAGLFDVSHMGQVILRAPSGMAADAAVALETLVPANIVGLPEMRQRYGLFTAPNGGVLDDLMIANRGDHLFLVVNASCADQDIAHLQTLDGVTVEPITDRALLALQGPAAEAVPTEGAPAERPAVSWLSGLSGVGASPETGWPSAAGRLSLGSSAMDVIHTFRTRG